ncbi:MAG: hypothetical protein COY81_00510 [Candidatus Pacebacteria bacterium CG_4_10_14_0_8_um_filter_43_12]|nr:MAG: hypothetical protein COU66_02100 [Candidatus Pacebacteria bacterium CG10_big_fil_rev_8_21_14_0_10_44_11]PIY79811.1 MAG: hypothetical protein COY81_00510 [Candidatus Pacebacteria bacterium CG_4_10_14_0_8_um_filter_43_12]
MKQVSSYTPSNILEEKTRFFTDPVYNPQFRYEVPLEKLALDGYGQPSPEKLEKAREIVEKAFYGRNEQDLRMLAGPILSQQEVSEKVTLFLRLHKLENRYKISWSSSYLSRSTTTADTIKLKSSAEFRKESLHGMLYHEIGTHALRRINYEKQPWFKKKKAYGFSSYLITEEGLASLHSLLPRTFKLAHSSALRYLLVAYAQEHSFAEVFQFLGNYVQDQNRRWGMAVRLKRGMEDTSQPGGYTKDLTYFEGMFEVAAWLDKNNYNLSPLYLGKLAVADVEKAKTLNPNFQPVLPSFYLIDPKKYAADMHEIFEFNHLLD